jgi:hypothetical protein
MAEIFMENCCAHCGFILNKPIHEGSTQLKQALIQTSCEKIIAELKIVM